MKTISETKGVSWLAGCMFFLVLVEAAEPVRSQVKLLLVRNLHLNSGLIAVDESLIMIDPKGKSHD